MRSILLLLVIAALSNAFHVSNTLKSNIKSLKMMSDIPVEPVPAEPVPEAPKPKVAKNAQWFPFGIKAPLLLDGTLAADAGFDPLRLGSSNIQNLYWMREAELKHARLAMLAAVGWPVSEIFHKELASAWNLPSILATNDRAPSLLNGGLSSPFASGMLIMSIIIAGYLESAAMNEGSIFWNAEKPKGYVPGDYKFDPLNLYGIRKDKKAMETAEIKNGRVAMCAITVFAVTEFTSKLPIVH